MGIENGYNDIRFYYYREKGYEIKKNKNTNR